MFLIGLCMGIAVEFQTTTKMKMKNVVSDSALTWMQISGELLLLIFLPGLLWGDAYGIDVHLFFKSLSQLLVLAFPLVLAGTALTACVAYYIFPYGWSFDLCMTFGSILSATDPVAVAVLLNELGAPPRLKVRSSPSCKSIKGHHSDNPYALSFPFSSCSNAAISLCKIWYVDARLRRSPSQRWSSLRFLHDLQNEILFLI